MPDPYAPGLAPKIRGSPSPNPARLDGLVEQTGDQTWGKASRKNPEMRSITSTRGRPSSAGGDRAPPRRPARTRPARRAARPSRARASATSSPTGAHGRGAPHHEPDRRRVSDPPRRRWRSRRRSARPCADLPGQARRARPWGRRSRSCARSAARGPCPGSGPRSARAARTAHRARPARRRSRPGSVAGPARAGRRPTSSVGPRRSVAPCRRVGGPPARAGTRPPPRRRPARDARRRRADTESVRDHLPEGRDACPGAAGSGPGRRSSSASPGGRPTEDVQAAADLGVLELAEVAVDVSDEVVERVVVRGGSATPRSRWSSAATSRSHTLARMAGQLGRVEGGHLGVLVEERLEAGHVVVGVGPGHGRQQVVDDDRVGPPLGLGALARVVDDEGVDEREVAQRHVGKAGRRQPDPLAREPLERAVLADVDDGVGAPDLVQPAVERRGSGGSAAGPGEW